MSLGSPPSRDRCTPARTGWHARRRSPLVTSKPLSGCGYLLPRLILLSFWLLLRALCKQTDLRFACAGFVLALAVVMRFACLSSVGLLSLLVLAADRWWWAALAGRCSWCLSHSHRRSLRRARISIALYALLTVPEQTVVDPP